MPLPVIYCRAVDGTWLVPIDGAKTVAPGLGEQFLASVNVTFGLNATANHR
jgi:hypothetical protein